MISQMGLLKGKYFKAADIPTPIERTINRVRQQHFDDGPKIVLGFENEPQEAVLNRSNLTIVTDRLGDDEQGWIGHRVRLHVEQIRVRNTPVGSIRVTVIE